MTEEELLWACGLPYRRLWYEAYERKIREETRATAALYGPDPFRAAMLEQFARENEQRAQRRKRWAQNRETNDA